MSQRVILCDILRSILGKFSVEDKKIVKTINIPAVRANELRLDNLFELLDGTVALVDYESEYKKADKVKYLRNCTVANVNASQKVHKSITAK